MADIHEVNGVIATVPCETCKGKRFVKDRIYGQGAMVQCSTCDGRGYQTTRISLNELADLVHPRSDV